MYIDLLCEYLWFMQLIGLAWLYPLFATSILNDKPDYTYFLITAISWTIGDSCHCGPYPTYLLTYFGLIQRARGDPGIAWIH